MKAQLLFWFLSGFLVLVAVTLSILCGCGDESNDDPAGQCRHVYELFCSKKEQCGSLSRGDCLAATATLVDCSRVVSVGPGYDACTSGLESTTCPVLESAGIPLACEGLFQLSQ